MTGEMMVTVSKKQSVGDVKWPDYHAQVIKKK